MSKIVAGITTSVDGYITGPDDGPGCGLGVGGERLHYWVFGGPWSYESPGQGEASGEDKAYLDEMTTANGAVIAGRGTYEAAGHWGDANPWGLPFFIVTHRPGEQPDGGEFTFAGSLAEAVERAGTAAGDKQVLPDGRRGPHPPGAGRRVRRRADPSSSRRWCSAPGNGSSTGSAGRWTWSTSGSGSPGTPRSSTTA